MTGENITRDKSPKTGSKLAAAGFSAAVFTVIGILIAPSFQTPNPERPGATTGIIEAVDYPLVERDGQYESPFVSVVETVQDAVVNVSARSKSDRVVWWQRENYSTSNGSGFFFRDDGYVLTNNHVVQNAEDLWVHTSSGYRYEATLVGADPQTDLAVLKVEPEEEITVIPFGNSDGIKVGDWAIAIGNPFPQQGLDRTVTVGVISAVGRSNLQFGRETPDYQSYIQTDASINPGNSGGPLLNIRGECIGVNAAISSPTGGSVGIGFAIPINLARAIVPDLISAGRASRGWLGVWFSEVTQREARRQGMEKLIGVRVDSVFADSPAQRAGIQQGDILVKFDGQTVDNAGRLSVLVSTSKGGAPVPLEVFRDGNSVELQAMIVDREQFMASSAGTETNDDFNVRVWLGMEIMTFTHEVANAIGVEHIDGVYIRRVHSGSAADYASVARGTIILQVGDDPVRTIEDIEEAIDEIGRTNRIPLIVQEPDGTIARKVVRL